MESDVSSSPAAPRRAPVIVALPLDILHNIFSHLQDPSILAPGHILPASGNERDTAFRETIVSLRLTCRLFHDIATPLLLPLVNVTLDQASLDRIDRISRHPIFSRGVHGVHVTLHYRPKELADSIELFTKFRADDLKVTDLWSDSHIGGAGAQADLERLLDIREAWGDTLELHERDSLWTYDDSDQESDCAEYYEPDEYRQALVDGHAEYKRKHEEQYRLVESGSFVWDLAASIARLPCWGTLDFHDMTNTHHWYNWEEEHFFRTMDSLMTRLTSACTWTRIEEDYWAEGYTGGEIAATRILSELPVAIRNAGATLRHLSMGSFPVLPQNIALLAPRHSDLATSAWGELRAAFSSLESVSFRGLYSPPLPDSGIIPPGGREPIDKYFSAAISGPGLKDVTLCSSNGRRNIYSKHPPYPIGRVLSTITSPFFRTLTAENVSMYSRQIEGFCVHLKSRRVHVAFTDVALEEGGWEELLKPLLRRAKDEKWGLDISFDARSRSITFGSSE